MDVFIPETNGKRDARMQKRRREVVWAAARLFDERGYHETTMDDIAAEVQVTKPTIYKYFESKGGILYAIHDGFIDLVIERHLARQGTAMSTAQLLFELMVDLLELHETHPGHVRVFFEHHRSLSPAEQSTIRAKRDRLEILLEELLTAGMDAGEFRRCDIRILAFGIFGICNWAYVWYQRGGALRPREIAQQYWDVIMRGIQMGPSVR